MSRAPRRPPPRKALEVRPRSEWSYGLLDRVFLHVRNTLCLSRTRYYLFGHSAGAQFAHRCLALLDTPRVELAVLGNSGWYMLPDQNLPFPSGLGDVGLDAGDVRRYLQKSIVILLGERDDDPNAPGLPREQMAMAQGATRLARGEFYFRYCKELAEELGVTFGWRLSYAPGVGHEDDQIAVPAADLIKAYLTSH